MASKATAQKMAINWLIEYGGEAEFVDNDNALRASNNSYYYANRSFWKAMSDRVEFINDGKSVKVKSNANAN